MRLLLPLALLGLTAPAHAQGVDTRLDTYWTLRARLEAEFMVPGDGVGQSQPVTWRHDALSLAKWSDGTIQLGWLIAVLATEHALLSDPIAYPGFDEGRPGALADTEAALEDALATLERLDTQAEPSFPGPWPCLLDQPATSGFFIRDDVTGISLPGITTHLSDYTDVAIWNKEMSQDQVYHLVLGLALVAELVPPGTVVDGRDLAADAATQAGRIGAFVADDGWVIRNPACDKEVDRGADASGYSVGFSDALSFVTGGAVAPSPDLAGQLAWPTLSSPLNPAYLNSDNLHMTMAVAATGPGYGTDTLDVLTDLAGVHDWVAYPLAHEVLHGPSAGWPSLGPPLVDTARTHLDELPPTAEPAHQTTGTSPHGFNSPHRYIHGSDEHYVFVPGHAGQRYHGLDAMALHNLLYLADPTAWVVLDPAFRLQPPEVCPGEPVTVSLDTPPPTGSTPTIRVDGQTTASPFQAPDTSGQVPVTVTLQAGGETAEAETPLTVRPVVTAQPPPPRTLCPGASTTTDVSTLDPITITPADAGHTLADGTLTVSHPGSPGELTLLVGGQVDGACLEPLPHRFVFASDPEPVITGPARVTVGAEATWGVTLPPGGEVVAWTSDEQPRQAQEATWTTSWSSPGERVLQATVRSAEGCEGEATFTVEVVADATDVPGADGDALGVAAACGGCTTSGGSGPWAWLALGLQGLRRAPRSRE